MHQQFCLKHMTKLNNWFLDYVTNDKIAKRSETFLD